MNFRKTTALTVLGLCVAGASLAPHAAGANGIAEHYAKKTVSILIPYGPGGVYDKYGQLFARHMEKFIPGKPTMIVQHMPGAGGAKAMNYAYNVMQKQGYNLITPLDNTVVNQLLRPEKMRYDARHFTWVGSSAQTNIILVVSTTKGIKSVEDWVKSGKELIGSSSGMASTSTLMPLYMVAALNVKGRVVAGYKGSRRAIMAIEQGEADMSGFNWMAWSSMVPHWFKGEKPFALPIAQVGVVKDPELPDVPMLEELVPEKYKAGARFLGTLGPIGRGIALPPGVPKMVIEPLRAAFDAMNADAAFAEDVKKRGLRLQPTKGAEVQKIINEALDNASPEVVALVRNAVFGGKVTE